MTNKAQRKILSLIMAAVMILTSLSGVTAYAEIDDDQETDGTITAFVPLAKNIAAQSVATGTLRTALYLPDTLTATVTSTIGAWLDQEIEDDTATPADAVAQEEASGETLTVTAEIPVTWSAEPEYDSDTEGTYVFTAVITDIYTVDEGMELPSITVTVEPEPQTTCSNHIEGLIWLDEDADGKYHSEETVIINYPVNLYTAEDVLTPLASVRTDEHGMYEFSGLEAGIYIIGVDAKIENDIEYLLPLVGITGDNKFALTGDYLSALSEPIDLDTDTVISEVNAGMRTAPAMQLRGAADSIYVNGTSGDDQNDGKSEANAVKTIDQAYTLVNEDGIIIVCGDTKFTDTFAPYNAPPKAVTFTAINDARLIIRYYIVYLNADTVFQNINLHNTLSGAVLYANGHTLQFGTDFELTEADSGGTGLTVIGGGCYGDNALDIGTFGEGSNLILKSGEFGTVFAGCSAPLVSDADFNDDIDIDHMYNVTVEGTAKIRDLYSGYQDDWMGINKIAMKGTNITVDGADVEIGNIWAGNYAVGTGALSPQEITQENINITINSGNVECIFGGSLVLASNDGKYTIENVNVDINGGEVSEILSGGFTAGGWKSDSASLDRVENMTITTSVSLVNTSVFSSGFTENIGYGDVNDQEHAETGTLKVILTGDGSVGDLDTYATVPGSYPTDAENKIIVFDNSGAAHPAEIPNGFYEFYIRDGGRSKLSADMTFEALTSGGAGSNAFYYEKDSGGYSVLTLNNPVGGDNPLTLDFIDSGTASAPANNQVLVGFSDETFLNLAMFELNPSNTLLDAFCLLQENENILIRLKETMPNASIDYTSETLTGLVANAAYEINGMAKAANENGNVLIESAWIGTTATVIKRGNGITTADSNPQNLLIPARPAVPVVTSENESVSGQRDGRIIGVTTAMEYSANGGESWSPCIGTAVNGLAAGSYLVRYKATDTDFTGTAANVTIASGAEPTRTLTITAPGFDNVTTGYTRPDAKGLIITNTGNSAATISSVTVSGTIFEISGSGNSVSSGESIDTWMIQPKARLSAGSYTETITVTYDDGTTATASVNFTVNRSSGSSSSGSDSTTYYTVTFNTNGGSSIPGQKAAENSRVIKPMNPVRDGYIFAGWYTDKELTEAYNFSVPVTGSITLYARWCQPAMAAAAVPATIDVNGHATCTITDDMVKALIEEAQASAKNAGKTEDSIGITITLLFDSATESITITIEEKAIERMNGATDLILFDITNPLVNFSFDQATIQQLNSQTTGAVTITAVQPDQLPDAAVQIIGSRPVYDITIHYTSNDKVAYITELAGGTITLGIAYTPGSDERIDSLCAVYVPGSGEPEFLAESKYTDGRVTFSRFTLSIYGVGYKPPANGRQK